MKILRAKLVLVGIIALYLASCTSIDVATPIIAIEDLVHAKLIDKDRVLIKRFKNDKDGCFTKAIKDYIENSDQFALIDTPKKLDEREFERFVKNQGINLILTGNVRNHFANYDGSDRKMTIIFFSALILTSPIALGLYLGSEWHVEAISSVKITFYDPITSLPVWEKTSSLAVKEKGKSLASEKKIKEAVLPVSCKNSITTILNSFTNFRVAQVR